MNSTGIKNPFVVMEALNDVFNADRIIQNRIKRLELAKSKAQASDERVIKQGHKLETAKAEIETERGAVIAEFHQRLEALDTKLEAANKDFSRFFGKEYHAKREALRSIRCHELAIARRKEALVKKERDKARRVVARRMGI